MDMMDLAITNKVTERFQQICFIAIFILFAMSPVSVGSQSFDGSEFLCENVTNVKGGGSAYNKLEKWYGDVTTLYSFSDVLKNSTIKIFDCKYLFIVETRPKEGIFGTAVSEIYSKQHFEFIARFIIEDG